MIVRCGSKVFLILTFLASKICGIIRPIPPCVFMTT